jgi:RNA polymerase-binding transcription factor DksA
MVSPAPRRGDHVLTDRQRELFARRLHRERDRTALVVDQTSTELSDASAWSNDRGDLAVLAIEREIDQLVVSQEAEKLAAIDEALRVLTDEPERFAVCRVCGADVAIERLTILPWTRYCSLHAPEIDEML